MLCFDVGFVFGAPDELESTGEDSNGFEMNYLARAATAAVVIAFFKLFLGRRKRSSGHSIDDTSQQSDSTPDYGDSHSVPLPIGEYEVFLNFRGSDTRDSITNILYRFLARSKIHTFRDDDELRKGEGIWPNLVKAIGQSKISIPIFSPRYAESKWCLKELAEIVEQRKREKGHIILPIFYNVCPRDVRCQTGTYKVAFQQHKRNDFDEENIQRWKAALTEVEQVVDMLDLGSQGVKLVGIHGMGGIEMRELPEFPESESLEILEIQFFKNRKEDLKIEKLQNLKVLRLKSSCKLGKIEGGTIGTMMKGLRELDLSELTIKGSKATTKLVIPPAASSREGDTSSAVIPWFNSSKLKSMYLVNMKRIIMVGSMDTMLPSSLTELTISVEDSERIPNLKNLRNLSSLVIYSCSNLQEVQGMGGLKSLQVLCIDRAKKLTRIHGLGNLMSCSKCKLTKLEITDCPLLREVVTYEQQDDDGGSDGERERDVFESLISMVIRDSPSIDCRSIPRLSKFPRLKKLRIKNIGLNIDEEDSGSQQQHQLLEGLENLEELVELYISNVELKRILNLKNLGNLTELVLRECPNIEEVQGIEGLKSLQVLHIDGARKLTRINGLGNLMCSSNCKLTTLEISKCPLLREVVTFEQQDDDGDDDDYDDVLLKMEILHISSIAGSRSTPWQLYKFPMVKCMKISELIMVLKGVENSEDLSEPTPLSSFLSKLSERLGYLRLEDLPALQEIGDFKLLWLVMNHFFSLERLHIKDISYSMHRIEFDFRGYATNFINIDFERLPFNTGGVESICHSDIVTLKQMKLMPSFRLRSKNLPRGIRSKK
ncbi:Disease resistance protein L6 [Linum perenne]